MAAPTIWVGTRKGLFAVRKGASGWNVGAPKFPGEPVSQFVRDRRTGKCFAALRLGHFGVKFWRSDDGSEWKEAAAPAFPPKPTEGEWKDDATPWTVDMVWGLAAADGVLWAGCLPAGLFRSADDGASWQLVESLWYRPGRKDWFGGGYDLAGIRCASECAGTNQAVPASRGCTATAKPKSVGCGAASRVHAWPPSVLR